VKPSLIEGLKHSFSFEVPATKTVPQLYPEAPHLREMPEVFATGFMVGLMEWTCMQLLEPHLDEGEGSLGVHIDVSHTAATPVGFTVTVEVECIELRGPRAKFKVRAHDGVDEIGAGVHDRFIMQWDRFNKRVGTKSARMSKEATV